MFEKSLQDVVRGYFGCPDDATRQVYIARVTIEIKQEISQTDMWIKSNAVLKLIYLNMIGFDMDWAAFHVIEIMSQPGFHCRRIGNLASSQSFTDETDVIVLCSNLLKKGLTHQNPYVVGNTLNCLSNICTRDLAMDLLDDVVKHLDSKFPYIRQKAVLALYKLYIKYPQALTETFDKLKEKLEDRDLTVTSSAVICELAYKKPSNYVALAPFYFNLLKTCENSWMLIKVVKLLCKLCGEEVRLAKKMIDPLTTMAKESPSSSLQFECINALGICLPYCSFGVEERSKTVAESIDVCLEKLKVFIQADDSNKKYLGLVGCSTFMKYEPLLLTPMMEIIAGCLDHEDSTIRLKALEIIIGITNDENLVFIVMFIDVQESLVEKLMTQVENTEDPSYRDELIKAIIIMCSMDQFKFCTNFAWYISVLVDLSYTVGSDCGSLVRDQLLDVVVRVPEVRSYAVELLLPLLSDPSFLDGNIMTEVLCAASWIVGEYPESIEFAQYSATFQALLRSDIFNCSSMIQSLFLQSVLKLFISFLKKLKVQEDETEDSILKKSREVAYFIVCSVTQYCQSYDVEVQERAISLRGILVALDPFIKLQLDQLTSSEPSVESPEGAEASAPPAEHQSALDALPKTSSGVVKHDLLSLAVIEFSELEPAEDKEVPIPEGVDLDQWIGEPFASNMEISNVLYFGDKPPEPIALLPELEERDPNYLRSDSEDMGDDEAGSDEAEDGDEIDDVLVETLDESEVPAGTELRPTHRGQARKHAPQMKYTVKRVDKPASSSRERRAAHETQPAADGLSTVDLSAPKAAVSSRPASRHPSGRPGDSRPSQSAQSSRRHRGEHHTEGGHHRPHRSAKEGGAQTSAPEDAPLTL